MKMGWKEKLCQFRREVLSSLCLISLFFILQYLPQEKVNLEIAPIMKLACSASKAIDSKHYEADVCIVCCTDDRFTPLMNDFSKARGYKHIDWIRVAGGAKDLEGEYLSNQVIKLVGLHHTKEVVIVEHIECGAYNGEKDEKIYTKDLQRIMLGTEELLKSSGLPIPVRAYLAKFDGLYEVK